MIDGVWNMTQAAGAKRKAEFVEPLRNDDQSHWQPPSGGDLRFWSSPSLVVLDQVVFFAVQDRQIHYGPGGVPRGGDDRISRRHRLRVEARHEEPIDAKIDPLPIDERPVAKPDLVGPEPALHDLNNTCRALVIGQVSREDYRYGMTSSRQEVRVTVHDPISADRVGEVRRQHKSHPHRDLSRWRKLAFDTHTSEPAPERPQKVQILRPPKSQQGKDNDGSCDIRQSTGDQ